MLVLNGDKGIPQAPLLAGVRQVAEHIETDIVPNSGHALAHDNPQGTADRLIRFFSAPE